MAISNNKKEVEKKRAQKKKDKQRRRDERRLSAPDSFDDMIAYVDENGNLCDTPPEQPAEKVDASTILVSTPPREKVETVRPTGIVDFFDDKKGFGFIRSRESTDNYFFHISNAPQDIKAGDTVTFDAERGQKGLDAVNIELLKA